MLSSVLLTKLSQDIRPIISCRKVSTDDLDMNQLLETFKLELAAHERANNSVTSSSRRSHHCQVRPPTSALVTVSSSESSSCVYCQQSHSSAGCSSVLDLSSCKKTLQDSGHCFNCLRRNHLSRNCQSTSRCKLCKKKHYTSICDQTTQTQEPLSLANPNGRDPKALSYAPSSTTSTLCSSEKKAVLLQTARTVIHNPPKSECLI